MDGDAASLRHLGVSRELVRWLVVRYQEVQNRLLQFSASFGGFNGTLNTLSSVEINS